MLKRILHTDLNFFISFSSVNFLSIFLYLIPILINAQDIGLNPINDLSDIFEIKGVKEEIIRLDIKRENLLNRKGELFLNQNGNVDQINRIEEIVSDINYKIENLQNRLKLEEEYIQKGFPVKGLVSDEEYIKKKQEWDKLNPGYINELKQKQIRLKKYEFEKLPKERQNIILSMPERYLIIEE